MADLAAPAPTYAIYDHTDSGIATNSFIQEGWLTLIFCIAAPLLGFVFSFVYYKATAQIVLDPAKLRESGKASLIINEDMNGKQAAKIWEVYNLIYDGAHSFLYAEYRFIAVFIVGFSCVILAAIWATENFEDAIFTVIAFIVGCVTSVLAGFIGMKIGVFANARTAIQCQASLADGFVCSFKAAVVMGFTLTSFGILNLYILIMLFRIYYKDAMPGTLGSDTDTWTHDATVTQALFEAIAGYGLGGSSIAMFGRVGGGIYTKAADVGADLVGKVEAGIPEDDPRNPAVIADNVGDNVGDIAGMGSDLFGSFAESSCAALVIAAQTGFIYGKPTGAGSDEYVSHVWLYWGWVSFPLIVSASGIFTCFITSFAATHCAPPRKLSDIEPTLKRQLLISTILQTGMLLLISFIFLPTETYWSKSEESESFRVYNWEIFFCAAAGLWCGLAIGYLTEYYTSNTYKPVQELSRACGTGAATNVILGLALGYKSDIIPAICLSVAAYVGHTLCGFYGVALAALGILSTMSIGLSIDTFGPICDNAGGIAEMCELGEGTRERTDALDAAGNTTAAIGKGFAIGSAAFVSLALFSGYMTILQSKETSAGQTTFDTVDLLKPFPFSGLLIGAMIPYWFSALTMKAVGVAAFEMVNEVRRQFRNDAGILSGESKPDYAGCIAISTEASLRQMIAPGALVMGTPLIVGFIFGCEALAGVLLGALVSGVQMAISMSNTGGAWDNAKKYIEQGKLGPDQGKGSDSHKAAIVGDTVGDPLKDTSGPAINIVMKLMAVESLVFARALYAVDNGNGLLQWAWTKIFD